MKLQEGLDKFKTLILSQLEYGAKKYALSDTRESTDDIFDIHGKNWLFGTMDGYVLRFKNIERERDLLKIATYCYILWLKKGFFIKQDGLEDVLDTTVELKAKNFNLFQKRITDLIQFWLESGYLAMFENRTDEARLTLVRKFLSDWSKGTWKDITERSIIAVYYCCYLVWFLKYAYSDTHDEDINNVNDGK